MTSCATVLKYQLFCARVCFAPARLNRHAAKLVFNATSRCLRSIKYFPIPQYFRMMTFSRKETIPKFDPINPRWKFALGLGVFHQTLRFAGVPAGVADGHGVGVIFI